ncbi:MAG: aminopeptidase P family protein [Aaplasma endosymbiont of Hyalomma asiaticum]
MDSRLQDLKRVMSEQGVDVLLIQHSDEYQSGYVHENRQRVRWICGFSGSYAVLVICQEGKCQLFTDSRYTIQAALEVNQDLYEVHDINEMPVLTWLERNVVTGAIVGYCGELFTLDQTRKYSKLRLKMLSCAFIDRLWVRPMAIKQLVVGHSVEFTGLDSYKKRKGVTAHMHNCDAMLITDVDVISWLLNVRNMEFNYNPAVLSRAILYRDGRVDLFIEGTDQVSEIEGDIKVIELSKLPEVLSRLANIAVDASTIPMSVFDIIKDKVSLIRDKDPCVLPKAIKNSAEIDGMKDAHVKDGVAVVNFLHWLSSEIECENRVTEIDAVRKIKEFRSQQDLFLGESFETISGFASNAAIVHYRVTPGSNRVLRKGGLYLIDSGGQYYNGTTDITRTVSIGKPSEEHMMRFTMVLRGFIALSSIVFPEGTTGGALDVLARQYLWNERLNYGHATGHGVGSFLSVHEGPQAIASANRVELMPGMVLSNEPGYYKQGEYGIRIENLMYVEECGDNFRRFKQLTCVPIETGMIKRDMLSARDIEYINSYHKFVYDSVSPYLSTKVKCWLSRACCSL